MKKSEKKLIIDDVVKSFQSSEGVFVVDCGNINAAKTASLKKQLHAAKGRLSVVKNTLLKLAAQKNEGLNKLTSFFTNQIAIIYAFENISSVASIIKQFSDKTSVINVQAGIVENKIIDAEKFNFIANMPSKDILYAQLCGVLQAPIVQIIRCLDIGLLGQKSESLNTDKE